MSKEKDASSCKYFEGIVAYMYGEMPANELNVFEGHLAGCRRCIDEFAAVSEARFNVYEWQRSEFAPLATPVIHLPVGKASDRTISWLDKLRVVFAVRPVWAAASVAILLAVCTVVYVAFRGDENQNLLGSRPAMSEVSEQPAVVNGPSPEQLMKETASRINGSTSSSGVESGAAVPKARFRRSEPQRVDSTRHLEPRNVVPSAHSVASSKAVPKTAVPTLSGLSEDDDNSLRLAELFDDVDTVY